MTYVIEIRQVGTEVETVKGAWVQVGTREAMGDVSKGIVQVPVFDYAPDREQPVAVDRSVYRQEVDALNVGTVIAAVNEASLEAKPAVAAVAGATP